MTVAVPVERFAGDVVGVRIAEVNLKYIWDVVSTIQVGRRDTPASSPGTET
jgi:hypothetical protein